MHLVTIAWLYVALMMAVAEGLHPQGSWLGGFITFMLYGLGPVSLVLYLLGAPMRGARRRRDEAASASAGLPDQPDQAGHAPGTAVAPVGKEP